MARIQTRSGRPILGPDGRVYTGDVCCCDTGTGTGTEVPQVNCCGFTGTGSGEVIPDTVYICHYLFSGNLWADHQNLLLSYVETVVTDQDSGGNESGDEYFFTDIDEHCTGTGFDATKGPSNGWATGYESATTWRVTRHIWRSDRWDYPGSYVPWVLGVTYYLVCYDEVVDGIQSDHTVAVYAKYHEVALLANGLGAHPNVYPNTLLPCNPLLINMNFGPCSGGGLFDGSSWFTNIDNNSPVTPFYWMESYIYLTTCVIPTYYNCVDEECVSNGFPASYNNLEDCLSDCITE